MKITFNNFAPANATYKLEVKQNQNIISKTSKQIVLNFETNFKLAKITILGCIEALLDSALSLKKESKNLFKSLPLYLEVEDFIRDLAKLGKLVQIPPSIISKQKELLRTEREKGFLILNSLF